MYDVVVVGGGPSGSSTGYRCAQAGSKVLIIEKGEIGRYKCCAGGLLRRGFRHLPLPLPGNIVEREVNQADFFIDGKIVSMRVPEALAVTVRRKKLDAFLLNSAADAGVAILDKTAAISIQEGKESVTVRTKAGEFTGRYLVIADGSWSMAGTALGPWRAGAMAMGAGVECETSHPIRNAVGVHLLYDASELRMGRPKFPMSGAVFPLRGSVMVSVVAGMDEARRLKKGLEMVLERMRAYGTMNPMGRVCYHPIPLAPRPILYSQRTLAVGDAAGFVSPFSGEGLTYALISAHLASNVISSALNKDDPSFISRYERLCRRDIIRPIRATAALTPWVHWIAARVDQETVLSHLATDERMKRMISEIAQDEVRIGKLLRGLLPSLPDLLLSSAKK